VCVIHTVGSILIAVPIYIVCSTTGFVKFDADEANEKVGWVFIAHLL
jgi:hypothetical protein